MEHTKEPWYQNNNLIRQESTDYVIARIEDGGHCNDSITLIPLDTQNANAYLIAAAPELLEALKIARDCMDTEGLQEDLKEINQAIAKAEGK